MPIIEVLTVLTPAARVSGSKRPHVDGASVLVCTTGLRKLRRQVLCVVPVQVQVRGTEYEHWCNMV